MGTRDEYVSAIKDGFVSLGTKGLMTVLVAKVPFFASPIMNYIARHVIEWLLKELVDVAEMQIFFLYIDFRTSKQGQAFSEAARKNQEAKKSGSLKEKADAEKALIDRFREFAKLTN